MDNGQSTEVGNGNLEEQVPRRVRRRAKAVTGTKFSFYIHLTVFVLVNLLLAGINMAVSPGFFWFLFPLAGWGFGLLIHALVAFSLSEMIGIKGRMYKAELERQQGN